MGPADEGDADDFVDMRTETGGLQRELLQASNELMVLNSNINDLEEAVERAALERDELSEEVACLDVGYAKGDPEVTRLAEQNRVMAKDVEERALEATGAKEELEILRTDVVRLKGENTAGEAHVAQLQQELTIIGNQPTRLSKQASVAQTSINNAQRNYDESIRTLDTLRGDLVAQERRREEVQLAIDECEERIFEAEDRVEDAGRRTQQHEMTLEQCRDAAATLQTDRAMMEAQQRQARREAKALDDKVARQTKEKERVLRALRHAEGRQASMQETHDRDRALRDDLAAQAEARRKEAASLAQATDKLDREVESIQLRWEAQNSGSQAAVATVRDAMAANRALERDLQAMAKKNHALCTLLDRTEDGDGDGEGIRGDHSALAPSLC